MVHRVDRLDAEFRDRRKLQRTGCQPTFEPIEADLQADRVDAGCRQEQSCAEQFQEQPRRGGATHLGKAGSQEVRGARQVRETDARGLCAHSLQRISRYVE